LRGGEGAKPAPRHRLSLGNFADLIILSADPTAESATEIETTTLEGIKERKTVWKK